MPANCWCLISTYVIEHNETVLELNLGYGWHLYPWILAPSVSPEKHVFNTWTSHIFQRARIFLRHHQPLKAKKQFVDSKKAIGSGQTITRNGAHVMALYCTTLQGDIRVIFIVEESP